MLPRDPAILVSLLNMKLRDQYPSFAALCDDLDEDPAALTALLAENGWQYDPDVNAFVNQ